MRVTVSITSLYLDFVYSKREDLNPGVFLILTVLTIVLVGTGCVSRVYLFAHTIN